MNDNITLCDQPSEQNPQTSMTNRWMPMCISQLDIGHIASTTYVQDPVFATQTWVVGQEEFIEFIRRNRETGNGNPQGHAQIMQIQPITLQNGEQQNESIGAAPPSLAIDALPRTIVPRLSVPTNERPTSLERDVSGE